MSEHAFKSTLTNINYFHNEKVSEKAIFLIPGGWSDWRAWSEYILNSEDSNKYSLYAVDPPGRGKSGDLNNFDFDKLAQPIVELIESVNIPNSYVIGESYGALMACEIGIKMGKKLKGIIALDPGWVITIEGTDIKEWGPVPIIIKNKPNWKSPLDAVYSLNGPDKENWGIDSLLFAINAYEASINSFETLRIEDNQDYLKICEGLKVKTYIARANPEKGGMIPDEVLKQVKNLNPLVEFHEFDTGHGIKSEAPKDFQKLIDRMLAN